MTDREKIIKLHELVGKIYEKQQKQADVTEIKSLVDTYNELYETLIENYLDFKEISDHLFDGIYVSDGEGKTIYVNEAYSRITGIDKHLVLNRTVKEISQEGKIYQGAVTMRVLEERKRISSIGKSLLNNREHLVTGSPIMDEHGEIRLVVINNRDITELRDLEQEICNLKSHRIKAAEEIKFLRKQLSNEIIESQEVDTKAIFDVIETIAPTDVSVLITGESGTGKEVFADAIFNKSNRKDKPFVKINCAAIPAELLESELFGYEKGAFTDASKKGKIGLFELANEGTILLDEIGDMPTKLQIKLLRVLQNKEIMRLGSTETINLDIRLIASTNKDLHKEMLAGRFRKDLYYRINVVPIHLKSLRERKCDIIVFANYFLERYNKKYGKNLTFEKGSLKILEAYDWPGNIREMENVIERIVVVNREPVIKVKMLQNLLHLSDSDKDEGQNTSGLKDEVERFETQIIEKALKQHGSINKAAKALKISQPALSKKCKRIGVNYKDYLL
ncbi:sigma-54 interaction domain-containing protein [Fusibacter ferrireducens]|uniref:HTH-type transcriptional regulatory protein TyrR n=1 Tax=Fusibacter ferrireducens TaxID=2785058 RepID=A0ABR9ZS02_9FIRM|nr:sigma 54-interacting transcriptional regulator [Fusibacter ferrireducens]MBF4693237.1 sigma 54-interacting transcriptional regulator [Fusibacter ferrireducens]